MKLPHIPWKTVLIAALVVIAFEKVKALKTAVAAIPSV